MKINLNKKIFFLVLMFVLINVRAELNCGLADAMNYPFFVGAKLGYGDADWHDLASKQFDTDTSVPMSASDSGAMWGFFAGYEFSPYFALQGTYDRYPDAELTFNWNSDYYPIMSVNSKTEVYTLIVKMMAPVFRSGIRVFADLGPAYMYRQDILENTGGWAATFGGGLNYNLTSQIMMETAFQFVTGNGKSNDKPVMSYMPFLYGVTFGLAYRFAV